MVERKDIKFTEEELIQKIVDRIAVARKRYSVVWHYGIDAMHTMYHISECIEQKKGCKVEKLLNAAKVYRELYKVKVDKRMAPMTHSIEDDGDYSFMLYYDKLEELRNPKSNSCSKCGQQLPVKGD